MMRRMKKIKNYTTKCIATTYKRIMNVSIFYSESLAYIKIYGLIVVYNDQEEMRVAVITML